MEMKCVYYECPNKECNLRFPSNIHKSGDLSCPKCKSIVSTSSSVELREETNDHFIESDDLIIEVLFDNIRSAWNVGSMIRTAEGFGVRHIYFCGITPRPDNRNIAKTSLGAEKFIDWSQVNNGVHKIVELKMKKYSIIGLEGHSLAKNIFSPGEISISHPLVLVVGNEVCGVDPEILALTDLILDIPMVGFKKSLNVAVAFGIAMSALKFFQSSGTNFHEWGVAY